MKIIIDDDMLNTLLIRKKNCIGVSLFQAIVNSSSGIAFLLTVRGADLSRISHDIGFDFEILCNLIGVAILSIGIFELILSIKSGYYNYEKLYQDILKLNTEKRQYSLVAIKNTFDEFPNKFLLYYDDDWKVDFFPAIRTVSNDEENIKDKLSKSLKIKRDKIFITFLVEKPNQKKYSEKDKLEKVYDHRYYQATIQEFYPELKRDSIVIDGIRYKWMTFIEMKNDKNIMKKNEDIIKEFEKYTT